MASLDIIIDHYSDDINDLERLLDSVANQQNIDFSKILITIINKHNINSIDIEKYQYPFELQQLDLSDEKSFDERVLFAMNNTEKEYILITDNTDYLVVGKQLGNLMNILSENPTIDILATPTVKEDVSFINKLDNQNYLYKYYSTISDYYGGRIYKRTFFEKTMAKYMKSSVWNTGCYDYYIMTISNNIYFDKDNIFYIEKDIPSRLLDNKQLINTTAPINKLLELVMDANAFCKGIIDFVNDTGVIGTSAIGAILQAVYISKMITINKLYRDSRRYYY